MMLERDTGNFDNFFLIPFEDSVPHTEKLDDYCMKHPNTTSNIKVKHGGHGLSRGESMTNILKH